MNFVFYNHEYNQMSCLPEWAQKTLREHSSDQREYSYSFNEFQNSLTHDPYWNAAQKEMVLKGKMHGYMRMYWGKKILEWTSDPEEAYQIALTLNNKYELDGGILMDLLALHGVLVNMTGHGRKEKYLEKYVT